MYEICTFFGRKGEGENREKCSMKKKKDEIFEHFFLFFHFFKKFEYKVY